MKAVKFLMFYVLLTSICVLKGFGQLNDSTWTLNKCIDYALQQNISVQKSELSKETNLVNLEQAKASRFPSVSASAGQNFSWGKQIVNDEYGEFTGSNSTNVGINSSVKLYNGFRTENSIKQSQLSYEASQYDVETIKESISLSVLDAYLQVLYADEQVKNSQKQIESTTGQLFLADERLNLGAISKSDYLLVKSELASEQLTLANAINLLTSSRVNLQQLLELPVTNNFSIESPVFDENIFRQSNVNPDSLYNVALSIKPQIKSSEINIQKSVLEIDIARAAYLPVVSLSGGVSTGYMSGSSMAFDYQMQNKISPSVGLSLSIPIYQNKQAKTGVALAKIGNFNAELDAANTRNQLRKEIEQAYADVVAAEKKYEASREQFSAVDEAYNVANEKYNQGLLNSVDFIIQKTNLINAESEFLQSRYNLVFSYKILDFYQGKPLTF